MGTQAKSDDGLEMHFAVNVLAPWRLTHNLLGALKKGTNPRVVNVTGGDKPAAVDVDNLQAEKGFKGLLTYKHSKSILEAMSVALSKKLEPNSITVNVVFPGQATTAMTKSLNADTLPGLMKLFLPCFKLLFRDDGGKSAAKASQSTIYAATSTNLQGVTGKYYDTNSVLTEMHPTCYDTTVQDRILSTKPVC